MTSFILVMTVVYFLFYTVDTGNVLVLFLFTQVSWRQIVDPVIEGLAENGHNVTVISPLKLPEPVKGIKEIGLEDVLSPLKVKDGLEMRMAGTHKFIGNEIADVYGESAIICEKVCMHPYMKEAISNQTHFDLGIVGSYMNACEIAFLHLFGIKTHISISVNIPLPWMLTNFGNSFPYAVIPNRYLSVSGKMTFMQRIESIFTYSKIEYIYYAYWVPSIEKVVSRHYGTIPPIREIERNASMMLVNTDPLLHGPMALLPSIVAIGGIHCSAGKPLPKEIEDFLVSGTVRDFILFSLGSVLNTTLLGSRVSRSLTAAFSSVNYKVLVKLSAQNLDAPPNVRVLSWVPQQDLLADHGIKLFMSHCGLMGIQEAMYHGVPLVCLPIRSDQDFNAARLVSLGVAIRLELADLTVESLVNAVETVTGNQTFKENMLKLSAIVKDQFGRPKERAVFWAEYVMRHSGAMHLESVAKEFGFIQYFLIDIGLFLATVCVGFVAVGIALGRFLINCFLKRKKLHAKQKCQ